jgi:lipopolysaccharide transport system permease protein
VSAVQSEDSTRPTEPDEAAAEQTEPDQAVEIRPYRPSLLESTRDVWRHRRVVRDMASQVTLFQVRFTVLGIWWIPAIVLFDTVGKALVFGRILNVPSAYGIPYLLFLSTGTMTWWLFNRTLIFSMRSFVRFRRQTTSLFVPLVLIPIASMWQVALEFAVYAVVLLGYFGVFWLLEGTLYLNVGLEMIFAPLGLIWILLLVLGLSFFMAPTFIRARDVRFTTRMALPFLMYVTPLLFPLSGLGGTAGLIARRNPLAAPVETVKHGILGIGVLPWYSVAVSAATTLVLLVAGLKFLNYHGLRLIGVDSYDDDDDLA